MAFRVGTLHGAASAATVASAWIAYQNRASQQKTCQMDMICQSKLALLAENVLWHSYVSCIM